ncbi:MAG: NAD-dependent epimerase/dehydratase family protein [Elusimicrobiota bacterium]
MKILVTGACGFVGGSLIRAWIEGGGGHRIFGLDNFIRPGSERNRAELKNRGVRLFHGDIRMASDFETLPDVDWVVDAAANPSVLAGVDGKTSSRQLVEHNLAGTVNMLEFCKARKAGFILLSTSRVYSIPALSALPMRTERDAFRPAKTRRFPAGFSAAGVAEDFSTAPPLSLYGATKSASEALALEYGAAFGFPVWIDRCGVLSGAGQFGHAEQGIFSYWIHSWLEKRPLRYIGFGGKGRQVRDCLHPRDLAALLDKQMRFSRKGTERVFNVSGGAAGAMSLAQLSGWCRERFGPRDIGVDKAARPFDIPWLVLDSARARKTWKWEPAFGSRDILAEIADFAENNPRWLSACAPG